MSGLFRINTNISAQFAMRQLSSANQQLNQANQRLSSGQRINSAADDAAGLAISKKMTSQIGGLSRGTRNAQDGISMVQTAEGALEESQSIVQRMRELSIQAANDTLTKEDRDKIQTEVNNLASELQRVADDTEFNERRLLDGSLSDSQLQVGANERQRISVSVDDMGTEDSALDVAEFAGSDESIKVIGTTTQTINGATDIPSAADGTYEVTRENGDLIIRDSSGTQQARSLTSSFNEGVVFQGTVGNGAGGFGDDKLFFSAAVREGDFVFSSGSVVVSTLPDQELQDGTAKGNLTAGEFTVESTAGAGGGLQLIDDEGNVVGINNSTEPSGEGQFTDPGSSTNVVLDFSDSVRSTIVSSPTDIFDTDSRITVGGPNVSQNISSADNAISEVDDALDQISEQRADLGATQNRLETTVDVNDITEENLSAARSRIRDADIASEAVNRTRANILLQASSSVLAQANQNPQQALQLLG